MVSPICLANNQGTACALDLADHREHQGRTRHRAPGRSWPSIPGDYWRRGIHLPPRPYANQTADADGNPEGCDVCGAKSCNNYDRCGGPNEEPPWT